MEIVIENPVESPPPPPPPPPPLPPPPPPSTYGTLTSPPSTKPPCGQQAAISNSNSSQMPAATTVMTITIAENPTAPSHPPVRFSYRESYASNALSCASSLPGDAFSRRSNSLRRPYDDPEGAPSVRRIDKSGLLGITEPEPSGHRAGLRTPRFLSGVGASGLVSPRRFECVGQLDPVPEVPGQTSRANVAPGAAQAYPCIPALDRRDPCEALSVATLSRPPKSSSFDSLEPRRNERLEVESLQHAFERSLEGVESSGGYGSFRFQEGCEARARTLGRLSRLSMKRESKIHGLAKYSETCCSFPFKARQPTTLPGIEGASGLPTSRATTATVSSSTTTSVATMREVEGNAKDGDIGQSSGSSPVPGEERAEAEGCEHGPTRNPMKDESSKRADELLDNDAIQTLRVIILSEQL